MLTFQKLCWSSRRVQQELKPPDERRETQPCSAWRIHDDPDPNLNEPDQSSLLDMSGDALVRQQGALAAFPLEIHTEKENLL